MPEMAANNPLNVTSYVKIKGNIQKSLKSSFPECAYDLASTMDIESCGTQIASHFIEPFTTLLTETAIGGTKRLSYSEQRFLLKRKKAVH